jgi:hypothetical protein
VDVVFAARHGTQVLECRTHVQPVLAFEQEARPVMRMMIDDPPGPGYSVQRCSPSTCDSSPGTPRPAALRYVFRPATNMPSRGFQARRWKLEKSAPECSPLEGGMAALAGRYLRVEGRAWGCRDASAAGCEDQAL